jgi:uncharacterized membrane protein YkvA (DUF1232 family)
MRERNPVTIELNPREQRLYDRLRSRVVQQRPGEPSGLGDLGLLLPDFTVLLLRLLRDQRVPLLPKTLAVAGIVYAISPVDLVPAFLFGPIGLVDDLVIVVAALSSILNHVHPDVVRSHWSGQGDALDAIQRAAAWLEGQVGRRLRNFLGRLTGGRS